MRICRNGWHRGIMCHLHMPQLWKRAILYVVHQLPFVGCGLHLLQHVLPLARLHVRVCSAGKQGSSERGCTTAVARARSVVGSIGTWVNHWLAGVMFHFYMAQMRALLYAFKQLSVGLLRVHLSECVVNAGSLTAECACAVMCAWQELAALTSDLRLFKCQPSHPFDNGLSVVLSDCISLIA